MQTLSSAVCKTTFCWSTIVKITIGIPLFNNRHTLIAAVQSVFPQTFSDWELFLVNDGSRDSSVELVRLISDPRVSVISDG